MGCIVHDALVNAQPSPTARHYVVIAVVCLQPLVLLPSSAAGKVDADAAHPDGLAQVS